MKSNCLIAAMALTAAAFLPAASAQARSTITVHSTQAGADKTFELSNDLKLSFGIKSGALTVAGGSATQTSFPLSQIAKITFSIGGAGVDGIGADLASKPALRRNPVTEMLEFTAAPENPCQARVFSLQGSLLLNINNWQGEDINVGSLPAGLYIFQYNNQTIKFYKK